MTALESLNVTLLASFAEADFAASSANKKQCSLLLTADISFHCDTPENGTENSRPGN